MCNKNQKTCNYEVARMSDLLFKVFLIHVFIEKGT